MLHQDSDVFLHVLFSVMVYYAALIDSLNAPDIAAVR